jgi:hypothetical protein
VLAEYNDEWVVSIKYMSMKERRKYSEAREL